MLGNQLLKTPKSPPPKKIGGGILSPHLAILLQIYKKIIKNKYFVGIS